MFLDEAKIIVRAGKGGNGCVSFRREKYVPKGGPDGGDGGKGGDVIIHADANITTLMDIQNRSTYFAKNGKNGSGKNKKGRDGADVVIRVPLGTIIKDFDTGNILRDLTRPGETVVVAQGGAGGFGNKHFATSTHQAPRIANKGLPGEQRTLKLELKLIADVGIIGMPNAGKSTLLAHISDAHPRIASYPFTTKVPQLGIVNASGYGRFIVADLPGLIENAHLGAGLGDEFLRHIERTRMLVHVVDAGSVSDGHSAFKMYQTVRNELKLYSESLATREEIIVANKMDLPGAAARWEAFQKELQQEVFPISAQKGTGLEKLIVEISKILGTIGDNEGGRDEPTSHSENSNRE